MLCPFEGPQLTSRADTGAAGGYVPFIGALSFVTWYRPIYLGFARQEGKAMAFFFCEPAHHVAGLS